jgi:hypothetical protein
MASSAHPVVPDARLISSPFVSGGTCISAQAVEVDAQFQGEAMSLVRERSTGQFLDPLQAIEE